MATHSAERTSRLHPGADSIPGDRGHRAAEFDSADGYREETRKSMKYLTFTFLIIAAISLGGCASLNATNEISPTQTPRATITTPLFTWTPSNTRSPLPSPTQTISPTTTFSVEEYNNLPKLSQVILTGDDARKNYSAEISNSIFFREPSPTEKDLTDELGNECILDCAKKEWYMDDTSNLAITLIRLENQDEAEIFVRKASTEYARTNTSIYEFNDEGFQSRNKMFGLPNFTYIAGSSEPNAENFFIVTDRGSVVILITDKLAMPSFVTDIDLWSHGLSMQFLAKLQNEKLQAAGYP
jgi:hypothetical protein